MPFHEDPSLWPYSRAPFDNHSDIVKPNFADTSALSDVDAFGCLRCKGRNGAKHLKRDRVREYDKIEHSWGVLRKSITPNLDPGLSHALKISGRPSQPYAHLTVGGARGSAAASPSSHSQSGAGSSVEPSQPNNSAPSREETPELSPTTGGPATAPPSSSNDKSIPNRLNDKASAIATTQAQTNGAATLVKSAASAATVGAAHSHPHPNGNSSLAMRDRNEFVREVLSLI